MPQYASLTSDAASYMELVFLDSNSQDIFRSTDASKTGMTQSIFHGVAVGARPI
jgi:hypothetical protein